MTTQNDNEKSSSAEKKSYVYIRQEYHRRIKIAAAKAGCSAQKILDYFIQKHLHEIDGVPFIPETNPNLK